MEATQPRTDAPQTMPLLTEAPGAPVETLPEEPDVQTSWLGRTTLLLLVVVIVAGGTLLIMRQTQSEFAVSDAAKAIEDKVELAMSRLAGAPDAEQVAASLLPDAESRNVNQVVAMFEGDPAQSQVPLPFLQKNPFVEKEEKLPPPVKAAPKTAARPVRDNKAARIADLRKQLEAMNVQTIIQGKNPMAIINGEIVKTGHDLGPFTVTGIDGRDVRLVSGDLKFILRMQQ